MKTLTLIGSPRKKGNSAIAAQKLHQAFDQQNHPVDYDIIWAGDWHIKPCTGCGYCDAKGSCYINDEMENIYKKIEAADLINFITPVYFGSMTGALKIMIDRFQPYYAAKYLLNKPRISKTSNKKVSLIVVSGRKNQAYARNIQEIIEVTAVNLNLTFTQTLYFPGVDQEGDIKKLPAFEKQIRQLAQLLLG